MLCESNAYVDWKGIIGLVGFSLPWITLPLTVSEIYVDWYLKIHKEEYKQIRKSTKANQFLNFTTYYNSNGEPGDDVVSLSYSPHPSKLLSEVSYFGNGEYI